MKQRLVRLRRLIKNAESHEQRALRDMATARQEMAAQESACKRLQGFHQEYLGMRHQQLVGQQSGRQLANMSAFVDRLQEELRAAEETLQGLGEKLESRRQSWLRYRLRRQRLELVLQQGEDQLRRAEDRLEQAAFDDWTSFRGGSPRGTGSD